MNGTSMYGIHPEIKLRTCPFDHEKQNHYQTKSRHYYYKAGTNKHISEIKVTKKG